MMVENAKQHSAIAVKMDDPAAVSGGKTSDGQLGASGRPVAHRHAAAQDDHGGQSADDNGIGKDLKDAEHPLLHGLPGIGAGMGDGARTKAGLIGEDTAGDAFFHAQEHSCQRRRR